MLSASDAGRIGRLVLPKKCAEAYFPAISQPEGLPLKVQDARGKVWIFQFRFWPNNNSRMYVLEGVTPCIQQCNYKLAILECVRGALKGKTIVLVTHQVDFLHNADLILVMRDGKIVQSGNMMSYYILAQILRFSLLLMPTPWSS